MDGALEDDAAFLGWLTDPDGGELIQARLLGDGRWIGIHRLMFHWTLMIGTVGDRSGYDDRYCYQTLGLALIAFVDWDGNGDPEGWHRHPKTGRRRPGGIAALQYTDP